jgi:hypothetical protein
MTWVTGLGCRAQLWLRLGAQLRLRLQASGDENETWLWYLKAGESLLIPAFASTSLRVAGRRGRCTCRNSGTPGE